VKAEILCLILMYIQQDAALHTLLYLETVIHVSGGTITQHQDREQLYLQHLNCIYSIWYLSHRLLLPAVSGM